MSVPYDTYRTAIQKTKIRDYLITYLIVNPSALNFWLSSNVINPKHIYIYYIFNHLIIQCQYRTIRTVRLFKKPKSTITEYLSLVKLYAAFITRLAEDLPKSFNT